MQQRKFGRTDLQVSALALGARSFGWLIPPDQARTLLDAYRASGGNFIQTAAFAQPGAPLGAGLGRSEEIVGDWLKSTKPPRDSLVLSTRIRLDRPPGALGAWQADAVLRLVESSLRRLQVNHLDLLVCEWSPAAGPLDDFFRAAESLMRVGRLRYVGAAGFPIWRFTEAVVRAGLRGGPRFELLQSDYSLLERAPFEPEGVDLARELRVALLAQSPLADGFLTGRYHRLPPGTDTARVRRLCARYDNRRGRAVLAAVEGVATETGGTPAQVALAWVLAQPGVTAPLLGINDLAQWREAHGATQLLLTPEQTTRLAQSAASADQP